jgi:hypothetical protein
MALLLWIVAMLCLEVGAAGVQDLVVFDEDDPLGRDYYDASVCVTKGPSTLRLLGRTGDKMPVSTNVAFRGRAGGVIEWRSRRGGDWMMHVFRPGFPLLDVSPYEAIEFVVNAPSALAGEAMPRIELQDLKGRVISAALGTFIESGVDSDTNTWQRVRVPVGSLKGEPDFALDRVKNVSFRQGAADGEAHVLWFDDLRLVSSKRAVVSGKPPAPRRVVGRPGDRSITLYWEPWVEEEVRYRVFRRAADDAKIEIRGSPFTTAGAADMQVENGREYSYEVFAENEAGLSERSGAVRISPKAFGSDDDFLEYLQATAFEYFWREANPANGMIRDRTQAWSAASVAAMGFGLTAIGIGIDHGWITREEGAERVRQTLRALWSLPQGRAEIGTAGYKGWFYHFLDFEIGTRFGTSELSSIDTTLLLAGVLFTREYFSGNGADEREIRRLAMQIFDRVDWKWMLNDGETLAMGWHPERGFTRARWQGYNEASILYLLGIGAGEANRLEAKHWKNWCSTYDWRTSYGYSFIHFAPLFGHQYGACWIDFRFVADDYTAAKGMTYFENSRRATLAQREYCIANPGGFPGYGPNIWGLTACDGPGSRETHGYIARGAPPAENDDGTIAPTAAGGSIPFTPRESIAALRMMYDQYRKDIWTAYGFRDAFNLREDWWGSDVIGIDQGPILIMIENYRTGRPWDVMKKNEILQRGLKRAGFRPVQDRTRTSKIE